MLAITIRVFPDPGFELPSELPISDLNFHLNFHPDGSSDGSSLVPNGSSNFHIRRSGLDSIVHSDSFCYFPSLSIKKYDLSRKNRTQARKTFEKSWEYKFEQNAWKECIISGWSFSNNWFTSRVCLFQKCTI